MIEKSEARILGRDEPGVFDHDVETMGSFKAYGKGLNKFSGPASFEDWIELPHRDADPTAWATDERGRTWFDATNNIFKFWDGTQILTLSAMAPGVTTLTEHAIPFGDANGYLDEDPTKFSWNKGTATLAVTGTSNLTGSLNVIGDTSLDGAVVVNEAGADKDFRIESLNKTHMFFVDASADKIGVLTNAPAFDFDINGTLRCDDLYLNDEQKIATLLIHWDEAETIANRTLDLRVNAGSRSISLYENLMIGDGYAVHIVFSGSNKTFTVEDDSRVNQDLTTDAAATLDDLTLTTPSNIYALSHDSFADFVANEHIDHTTVSISAGGILSGGGTIAANRTISLAHGDVDHDQLANFASGEHFTMLDEDNMVSNSATQAATQQSVKAYVDAMGAGGHAFKTITGITNDVVADIAADTLTLASADAKLTIVGTAATDTITFSVIEAQIDHDALTNFVAAEHVSLPNTIVNVLSDHDLAAHTALGLFDEHTDVDHDQTTNFVANEHIDHTAVTFTAGSGLSGGGTIAANRTFDLGALTSNWDAGGYQIRALKFYSDQATGTAPFTVASTTVVTSLNADRVDGEHASAIVTKARVDAVAASHDSLSDVSANDHHAQSHNMASHSDDDTYNFATSGTAKCRRYCMDRETSATCGLLWYNTTYTSWQTYMTAPGASKGYSGTITAPSGTIVTSWALRNVIEPTAGFGWTWEEESNTGVAPTVVAELRSSDGLFYPHGGIRIGSYTLTAMTANNKVQDSDKVDGEHASAIVTDARVKAHFPDTIVNILSDHNTAAHDALNIDADTLDSLNSSSFLRSDQADNIGADLTLSGGAHIYRNVNSIVSIATPIESWNSNAAGHTGAIYFVLPAAFSSTMITLEFDGYVYNANGVWMALIGGYAYSAGDGSWINYNCQKFGSWRPQIRLGSRKSDNRPVIIFGDDGTVWSYPKISLMRATFGHSGITAYLGDWESGTTTTVTTLFDCLVTPTDKSYVEDSNKVDGSHASAFILHSLADAANDFLVASGANTYIKKTLAQTGAILEGDMNHDNLQGFVANEHINHTSVTMTAGSGLSGGGTIAANRTFNLGTLTANWDAGGYQIRALKFYSDQATGVAPFTVLSTTKVTNLNADYLDNYHAASAATVNTIALRNSSGYLFAVYFNMTNESHSAAAVTHYLVENANDNYLRWCTPANFVTQLVADGLMPKSGGTFTSHVYAADHGTAATDMIVNVCYGTGNPPAANTTTIGTLYVKYTG